MEVDTTRQTITVNKSINTKKELITVEGDMIIPDVKPDILNTIETVGNVCIYKKEVLDGKIRFDGSINLNIIYLADSQKDTIRGLNNSLDFTQMIDIDNCRTGMNMKNNIKIKQIECKVLNGRKINIKVILEIDIHIYSNEDINILKQINNVKDMQILNSNMQVNNLIGTGTCRAYAKDTISLDETDNLAEILKTQIKVINNQSKVSYNKILLKADSNVKIMYLTENGEIKVISSNIPIMGFIDMKDVADTNILNSNYEIKNIIIKPNSNESNSIYIEVEFEISCEANDVIDIELIQDMYSLEKELQFNKKEISTITNKNIKNNICNIQERISIPEISSNQIYDVDIISNINNTNILNGRIIYEGDLNLNFIFSEQENTIINTKRYILPFTYTINDEEINSNKIVNTKVNCTNDEFVITSDGMIECKIDLEFILDTYDNANINIINEINMLENKNNLNPSLIIYIVKEGDKIWNIAKQYRTTMQDIIDINKLEDPNNLIIGQKIFIPHYSLNRINSTA